MSAGGTSNSGGAGTKVGRREELSEWVAAGAAGRWLSDGSCAGDCRPIGGEQWSEPGGVGGQLQGKLSALHSSSNSQSRLSTLLSFVVCTCCSHCSLVALMTGQLNSPRSLKLKAGM
jgi:hypothetical protein